MTQQIQAIYENGVLRPLEPLTLPEHQRVRISINGMVGEADDTGARQRAAMAELDIKLSELPSEGRDDSSAISELDRSLYGRPE